MERFARLEEHHGMQVLAFVETTEDSQGNYGPCITYRTDAGISMSLTTDAYPNTVKGWDEALKAMDKIDFAEFAKNAKSVSGKLTKKG